MLFFFLRLRSELKCALPLLHKLFAFKQLVGRQGLRSSLILKVMLEKNSFFSMDYHNCMELAAAKIP